MHDLIQIQHARRRRQRERRATLALAALVAAGLIACGYLAGWALDHPANADARHAATQL